MGLFDMLEEAAGFGGGASPGQAAPQGALAAVVQMVQAQPGGLGGVLQKLEGAGLGGAAQSWLGSGSNQPVSPDQVQSALGQGPVGQVADRLGVPPGQAAQHIADFLPQILDHLSPGGQAPAGGGASELEGLLSKIGGL